MIRLGVNGALGRMGSAIIRLALASKDFSLAAVFERPGRPEIGTSIGELRIEAPTAAAFKNLDVAIDFTEPDATLGTVGLAGGAGRGVVIGTTGFSPDQIKEIERASVKIPIVFSPNMSVGANLLFDVAADVAFRLGSGYDIEVIEAHHRLKKDAPSGTAKRLAESIARAKGWDLDTVSVYGRKGLTGPRKAEEIGIHVIRAGEIVGDHTVIFSGPGESIEISHKAFSRDAFAQGALLAARFLAGKKNGLFNMQDVLASQNPERHGR